MTRQFLAALFIPILCSTATAYDIEQFIKDTQKNPERIYKKLHPDAKAYVDRGIKLYQTSEAFREDRFVEFEEDPSKMKAAKIWSKIWDESGYTDIYSDGHQVLNTFDRGDWRYVTVKEEGWDEEVIMIATYTFRKSGDNYLFYPPGWVMDYFTPLEFTPEVDFPEALQEMLKSHFEKTMTDEDKEAFKNAQSPMEAAELIQKILSNRPEN